MGACQSQSDRACTLVNMGACQSQSDRHEPTVEQRLDFDEVKASSQEEVARPAKEESSVADQKELLAEDAENATQEAPAQEEGPEGPEKVLAPAPAMSAIDSVELPMAGIEEREGHTHFKVQMKLAGNGSSWTVSRYYHYSEFFELRKSLNTPTTVAFPRKHLRKCTGQKLEARREGLEAWLNEVIAAPEVQKFLQPAKPVPRASESSTHVVSDTQLQTAATKLKKAETVEKNILASEKPDASQIAAAADKLKPTTTTENNSLSTEKPDASQIAAAAGKLKPTATNERNSLPTKEDIEAEKTEEVIVD